MSAYQNIEQKLHQFVKKYYKNELIKGGILFFSLGLLYLFFTVFIEYFLWLNPFARTFLFWVFIGVEFFLLFRFIAIPIFKLIGFKKGISFKESSQIIGNHFPEISDKLTNILQLQESNQQSDLLLASIQQKSKEIQPIPFVKAVDFKQNTTYLKYTIIPVLLFVIVWLSGNVSIFNNSLYRVVNHNTAFVPPAPFAFQLLTKKLQVIEGNPIKITFKTVGKVVPDEATIHFNKQRYFLQNDALNEFSYEFIAPRNPIDFYVEANGIISEMYQIEIIKTPTIQQINIALAYPVYTRKKAEKIKNTGNILVLEGTQITWEVTAKQTDTVSFYTKDKKQHFYQNTPSLFTFQKKIKNPISYQIASSNAALHDFEKLGFNVEVIKDAFPTIEVISDVDSLSNNFAQFAGRINDDYGFKKLEMVFYDEENPTKKFTKNIEIKKTDESTFYAQFPGNLSLQKGINYEVFFQVFDNDGVNGSKSSKSKVFSFRHKTAKELEEELLQDQRNQINLIENSLQKKEQQKEDLKEIQQNLKNTKNVNWNDKKKIQNFVKRQQQYKQMMQRQTDKLQKNLKNQPKESEAIQQKKESLQKRIEELKKLEKENKLLKELERLANKLNKEDLLKRVQKLTEQNKQQERSLERVLELTKRFYVEQKTMQIAEKLSDLSKQQQSISKDSTFNLEQQQKVQKEFNSIQKELETLQKDNQKLKEPMQLPDTKKEEMETKESLQKAQQPTSSKQDTKKNQLKAAKKMQEMSMKMKQSMQAMEGEMKEANEKSLRIILENLLNFSFKQEALMNRFSDIDVSHPNFGKELKNQYTLKTYFEHVDDSLYVLSMRLPEISATIQKDLTEAHYNLNQSLENFAESRFNNGISNQQYTMTSANNLADFLSTILDNMQQPKSSKPGKGKKRGKSFSLPDIIKKQSDLVKKMEQGTKKGEQKKGNKQGESKGKGQQGKGNSDEEAGELYKIYQEQSQLRQELQNALKNGNGKNNSAVKKVLKSMEQLENEILEKGFQSSTIQRMQQLQYNLLKLEKAALEQNKDLQRKSTVNQQNFKAKELQFLQQKLFYNQTEILNRQSLPLQKIYNKKVQEYFKTVKGKKSND